MVCSWNVISPCVDSNSILVKRMSEFLYLKYPVLPKIGFIPENENTLESSNATLFRKWYLFRTFIKFYIQNVITLERNILLLKRLDKRFQSSFFSRNTDLITFCYCALKVSLESNITPQSFAMFKRLIILIYVLLYNYTILNLFTSTENLLLITRKKFVVINYLEGNDGKM